MLSFLFGIRKYNQHLSFFWTKMKNRIFFALFLCILQLLAVRTFGQKSMNANEKEAHSFYSKNSDSFRHYSQKAIEEYIQNHDTTGLTRCYQNMAFEYDEVEDDIPNAFVFTSAALCYYQMRNDTLQIANLYKYIGRLYGRLGVFAAGKNYLEKAVALYKTQKFEKGIYVSYLNLASLYVTEGNFREAKKIGKEVRSFWTNNFDAGRLFDANTLLLECKTELSDQERTSLIKANDSLLQNSKIPAIQQEKFKQLRR